MQEGRGEADARKKRKECTGGGGRGERFRKEKKERKPRSTKRRGMVCVDRESNLSEPLLQSATISKRRNRLKADIVEALQFLKCLSRNDLLYSQPMPCSVLEGEFEVFEDDISMTDECNSESNLVIDGDMSDGSDQAW